MQAKKSKLTKNDYKTLALSSLGGMLEFYDFVIFVFFTGILSRYFFPDQSAFLAQIKTLGIFAAGYLARPVGGVILAHFGDKLGRKKMFAFSIFMMAVPTLAIGLLPTYAKAGLLAPILLLLCRILQGAAVGGEVPGMWVFIAEHMSKKHYGMGMGVVNAGITGGILLGSLVAMLVSVLPLSEGLSWRIPFIIGGIFGLIGVYLRRFLDETPVFKQIQKTAQLAKGLPLKEVLQKHKSASLLTAGLTFSHSTASVVAILMTPSVVFEGMYQIPRETALQANCFATIAFMAGCAFWGVCVDKLGVKKAVFLAWGSLVAWLFYFYSSLYVGIGALELTLKYCVVGFCAGAIVMTPIISTRAFPPAVRYSGLSFAYNLSYAVFGGFTPVVAAAWLGRTHMAPAYYVGLAGLMSMLLCLLPLAFRGYKD